jgi:hypothetical protein
MNWSAHRIVFRLRTPLHIGCGKVGNLQRNRPYVTGRALWGALTMRLTRDAAQGLGPATDSVEYERVGNHIHQSMAFTYFYPATMASSGYQVAWPWDDESRFRSRFLSSYQSTALNYPAQSAATGMLHEQECIVPNTMDAGEPVFLVGYAFASDDSPPAWKAALTRVQLGGERGYGWGSVALVEEQEIQDHSLFSGMATFEADDGRPQIRLPVAGRLLAHTLPTRLQAQGDIEPLVGREWRAQNQRNRHVGQHVNFCGLCFAPGSQLAADCETRFCIGRFGVWEAYP